MSLALKLSEIRAKYEEIERLRSSSYEREANEKLADLCAANFLPMLNVLDDYEKILVYFSAQKWARNHMRDICNTFGVEPPPNIT